MQRLVAVLFLLCVGAQILLFFQADQAGGLLFNRMPELQAAFGIVEFLLLALFGTLVIAGYRHQLTHHIGWVFHLLQKLWSIREGDHGEAWEGLTKVEPDARLRLVSRGRYTIAPLFFGLAVVLAVGAICVVLRVTI